MTGETANGRSISVISTRLPGKSKRAIAHAAATPNTAFAGTEMAATSRVSRIAASALGSVIAAQYTSSPPDSAWPNTTSSGSRRNSPRKVSATPISVARTQARVHAGHADARRLRARVLVVDAPAFSSPPLQCVDAEQQHE